MNETAMSGFGAKAYQRVGVETGVESSEPHALILMLFDGVLESVKQAQGHLAAGRVLEKGAALSKAARIVEEGLKASLDRSTGGAIAQQLAALYDYAVMRLLQANLRNDYRALMEVAAMLADLRSAWATIGQAERALPLAAPAPTTQSSDLATGHRFVVTA
jgi:flagellar protein FliS